MTYLNRNVHSHKKTENVFLTTRVVTRVWQQLEYRIDVCRVTRSAHVENL
jgi:hypothetical protein